jgi:anti-sigma regulatory factor (Ser/Thr protein kinase)
MCEWGLEGIAETVELVVSELTTNAVLATTGPDGRPRYENALSGLPVVHVRLLSDRVRVVIEVWDASTGAPILQRGESDKESGRGLILVEAVCERWDWATAADWRGKVVWAELRAE